MTQTEPKVRKDGRCVVCDKPRPGLPPLLYADPFCSSVCCKAYYGVQTSMNPKGRPAIYEREAAR